MTASLHRLGAGHEAGIYYTNDSRREAKPRNRDEYYARDGDGAWWSTGNSVVRHGAAIDLASFRDLCAGVDPGTGQGLVRGAGPAHWAGVDLTMSPAKSLSLLWAAGTAEQRALIETAHRSAVDEALKLVEDEGYIIVRSGAGGKYRNKPSDIIVARFDHYTTREGDPSLHTHCVFMNVAGTEQPSSRYKQGRHLTIDPDALYRQQLLVGSAFRSALAARLAPHGFTFRPAGQGQWELSGVPQDLIEQFSQRSHQIEERVGRGATGAQKEIAALATRSAKDTVPSGQALEERWAVQFAESGVDPWAAALAPGEQRREVDTTRQAASEAAYKFDPPEIAGKTPVALAASALFRNESVITRSALLRTAFIEAALQGIGIDPVYAEIEKLEGESILLRLGSEATSQRWTAPSVARVEAEMLRAVARTDERVWIDDIALAAALDASPHLSDEQREAVWIAASPDGVSIIEAGAGTGKTTAARAIVDAAQRSGLRIVGLAPSWVAADELARSTGIEAKSIGKWRHEIAKSAVTGLDHKTLLLVDEAGMASMRDMAAIVCEARKVGSKVLLIGDRRQLQSVPGGSALRAIGEVLRQKAVMEAVRRQAVDWQRAASLVMARGDAEAGLRTYARQGRVEFISGHDEALRQVVERWRELRATHGDDVLIVTRRNDIAAQINLAARQVLRSEGRLVGEDVVAPSINRENEPAGLSLAVGDVLRFGETLSALRIRNGSRGTVQAVHCNTLGAITLGVLLEDGRHVEQPWAAFARAPQFGKQRPPRVVHAYAGTAYSAQGRTAAATVHYVGSTTDARETYVALTRHRRDMRIVVERDRLDAMCRQRQADPRLAPTSSAIEERLFKEASQYSEKANVVDFVADRLAFITTGDVTKARQRRENRSHRMLQAARGLRDALRSLAQTTIFFQRWRLIDAQLPHRSLGALRRTLGRLRQSHVPSVDRTDNVPEQGPHR